MGYAFCFFNTMHEFGSEKMEDLQRQLLGWLALERELERVKLYLQTDV